MIPDEIKQSVIDIVHQETWKTASLTTAAILAGSTFIIFLAKNWLLTWIQSKFSHEFNQKLEAYKSDLQKDVESYKSKIQTEFEVFKLTTAQAQDRRTRSNEKEYDACIECWKNLNESYLLVKSITSGFRPAVQINDLDKKDFDLFIEEYDFSDLEKNDIFNSKDRNRCFSDVLFFRDIVKTKTKIEKAKKNLSQKGIFIEEDLYKSLEGFLDFLSMVWAENFSIFHSKSTPITTYSLEFIQNGQTKIDSIRNVLRKNLHIRALEFTDQFQRDALKLSPAQQPSLSDNSPEPEPTAPK